MAKTLATYRDEAQATFDDDTILGAFPVWLEDAVDVRPVSVSKGAMVLGAGFSLLGPVFAFVGVLLSWAMGFFRQTTRPTSKNDEAAIHTDTTSATMLVRADRLDIHELDSVTLRSGGRMVSHGKDRRVQIGRSRLGNATVIDLEGSRWMARRKHERALRGLLTAQGYRIEPLA